MAQLHRNPKLNEFFQRYLCEDGVIRVPKEARDELCDIAEDDFDRFDTGISQQVPLAGKDIKELDHEPISPV